MLLNYRENLELFKIGIGILQTLTLLIDEFTMGSVGEHTSESYFKNYRL